MGGPTRVPRRPSPNCGGCSRRRGREGRGDRGDRAERAAQGGPDEVARPGARRAPVIRARRAARACPRAAGAVRALRHRAVAAAAAGDPRVPGGWIPRAVGREPPGAGAEPARRPVSAGPVRRSGARSGARDRLAPRGPVGAAARGLRRRAVRHGAGLPPGARGGRRARPAGAHPRGGRRGRIRVGGHDGDRVPLRRRRAPQHVPVVVGRVITTIVGHGGCDGSLCAAAGAGALRGRPAPRSARPRRGARPPSRRRRVAAQAPRLCRRLAAHRGSRGGLRGHRLRGAGRAARDAHPLGPPSPAAPARVLRRGRRATRALRHGRSRRSRAAGAAGGDRHGPDRGPRLRTDAAPMERHLILDVRGVSYRYPSAAADALACVSLNARAGEFHAVLGPNGSGKTTLVRVALGLLSPQAGTSEVLGRPATTWSRRELARVVAVVTQREEGLFPQRVRETVLLGRYPHLSLFGEVRPADRAAVERALVACDAADLADRWLWTLSGGEYQRVRLARALAQEPKLLVLDEPTVSLDLRHEMELFELVRTLVDGFGLAALMITHHVNLAARFADQILILAEGRAVARGAPAAVLTRETVERVFSWPVAIEPFDGRPQMIPLRRRKDVS